MPFPNLLHLRSALLRVVLPVGGALVVGCEATGPRSPASVSLSVATLPGGSTNVGTGANSVKITSVEFVLAETEIAHAATRDPLQVDPILINVPLGGAPPRKVLEAPVSTGTYTKLQAMLHAVRPAGGFRTAHPDWPAGVSVRVAGIYTDPSGVPHDFTFTSAADAQLQMAFARPVTIDAARNLTMVVNVARWFRNGQGTVMDPRSSANAAAINANISRSFQAFQDDDEDGVEDDPNEVDDDSTEVDDDSTEVDDDSTEVDDDASEVEDDTTALLSLFQARTLR